MNLSFKSFMNLVLLLAIMAIIYSFAMFQGGFLSWFLLYAAIPFFLYYLVLLFYPIKRWWIHSDLSQRVVHAGDEIILKIELKRKIPFPLPYMFLEIDVPETLHKKDTRQRDRHLFSEQNIVTYFRELKAMFFPWFRRRIKTSFTLDYLPRGEHKFDSFTIKIGDLFGFVERKEEFKIDANLIVYPVERQIKVMQYLSSFDGGSVPYYTHQLKHTSVAGGVREYIPGDKFSWIDWKQTARQQEIMTKEFEQEKSAEMMMVFNSSASDYLHPIAFEAAVELALAMFEEMNRRNGGISLLSIGERFDRFTSEDVLSFENKLRDHFARVQPAYKSQLIVQLGSIRNEFDLYDTYIFITTLVDREFLQAIDLIKSGSQKIVVLYIQARQFIHEEEEKNMHILRREGINTYILTDKQLSFDPIEVKF